MSNDFNDLVKAVLSKTDRIFIPDGKTLWRLPTGIPSLDKILGGGIPAGTITQIYGPETSGKSTLAYHIAGQAVKLGYKTAYFGIEGYSEQYAQACGVDTKSKLFTPLSGDFAEEIFNMCIEGVRNHDLKVIVMDSIVAAIPKANIDKKQPTDNMDKGPNIGAKARSIGYFVEQLQNPIRRKHAMFIAVNQLRSNIGRFVTSLKPAGGMALQYYSDVKISMWGKEDANGNVESKVTVKKGKEWEVIPFGATVLYMRHGHGIDINRDVLLVCEKAGIIKKGGSWYTYKFGEEEVKFQGLGNFSEALRDKPELREELYQKATQANIKVEVIENEESEESGLGNAE